MHIVIAGGSGFVGENLTKVLLSHKHQITILTHSDISTVIPRLCRHLFGLEVALELQQQAIGSQLTNLNTVSNAAISSSTAMATATATATANASESESSPDSGLASSQDNDPNSANQGTDGANGRPQTLTPEIKTITGTNSISDIVSTANDTSHLNHSCVSRIAQAIKQQRVHCIRDSYALAHLLPRELTVMPYEEYNGEGDVFINLAGESLGAKAITRRRLRVLLQSRLDVLECLSKQKALPPVFIQASAVAVYANSDQDQNEDSPCKGTGEIAELAHAIEKRASELNEQFKFKQFYLARFGIVLHRSGGLIKKASAIPPFTVIHGTNKIPFIELFDAVQALIMLCNCSIPSGPINFTSPHFASLQDILRCCYRGAKLPPIPIITGFLKLGDRRIQLLNANQRVIPQTLLDNGFRFVHADIDSIK